MAKRELKVIIITGRSIEQGIAIEGGKMEMEYPRACGVCYMDPSDMEKLDLIAGDPVLVRTKFGEVVLTAVRSEYAPHEGIVFIPMGPWANKIIDPNTSSIGMPSFKGVEGVVQKLEDLGKRPPTATEIVEEVKKTEGSKYA
ncbi:MAG: molybdopterin dinucleotide binding domain-containing protein [Candidatus Baldrarchaeia archaeon]